MGAHLPKENESPVKMNYYFYESCKHLLPANKMKTLNNEIPTSLSFCCFKFQAISTSLVLIFSIINLNI